MEAEFAAGEGRPVLVYTEDGPIEGRAMIHPGVRTLDWLNVAQPYVAIEVDKAPWDFEPGTLQIKRERVLFVLELSDELPISDGRVETVHYTRAAISLRVGQLDMKGYMHMRGQDDPVVRLGRNKSPFVALTAASIVGPDVELAAGFLAVNPAHILAAQKFQTAEPSRDASLVAGDWHGQ